MSADRGRRPCASNDRPMASRVVIFARRAAANKIRHQRRATRSDCSAQRVQSICACCGVVRAEASRTPRLFVESGYRVTPEVLDRAGVEQDGSGAGRQNVSSESWSERRDSNPRPLVPQTSALTGLRYAPSLAGKSSCSPVWGSGARTPATRDQEPGVFLSLRPPKGSGPAACGTP